MKKLLTTIAIICSLWSNAQKIDTVIHYPNYTSYYSYKLHNPVFVIYKLYKGGGSCSRVKDRFITDNLPNSATTTDYAASGFDEGHLADSKDFAYDCKLQEETFRFFNCVPQTPALNRGIWKHYETIIRQESQTDSLLIICGSIFGNKTIGIHNVSVPTHCFKIVYKIKDKSLLHSLLFHNDNSDSFSNVSVDSIKGLYRGLQLPF